MESGEKTESDEHQISISKMFPKETFLGLHPSLDDENLCDFHCDNNW